MNGAEFLKEFRETIDRTGVPFLMMGVDVGKADIAILAEYEIDGFITKPFTFIELARKISHCAQYYRQPNHSERLIAEAKELLRAGEYEKAFEQFKSILSKMPKSARIRVGMAQALHGMGDLESAINFCKEAVDNNALYVQSYDELSLIYFEQNNIEEGINMFRKAISLSPYNPLRYQRAYDFLFEKECYEDAERVLLSAKDNRVAIHKINEKWGTVLFFQRKMEKSLIHFEKALRKDSENRALLNMMAIALKSLGRYEEALKYYNMALKDYPNDIKLLFNKGLCYFQMNDFVKSRKIYEAILRLEPGHEKAQEKRDEIIKIIDGRSKKDVA
jgi:tetratricopeptide (TPR) repeat protein